MLLFCLLLLCSINSSVVGHVALSFPPARKYSLDFLDNFRTKPPCGMPKGDIKTSLKAGSSLNITWNVYNFHKGGYRIELLDETEKYIRDLTPTNPEDFLSFSDLNLHQQITVTLPPNTPCKNCIIRLVSQALEWGHKYKFWSCSDVDIVLPSQYKENCLGHGKAIAGKCRCDRLYFGLRCQYKHECLENDDCGKSRGICVRKADFSSLNLCFCTPGHIGDSCSQISPLRSSDITEGLYTLQTLSENYTLFWRILQNSQEIEIVLKYKGTGYVAIGWRPSNLTSNCKKWPEILEDTSSTTISSTTIPSTTITTTTPTNSEETTFVTQNTLSSNEKSSSFLREPRVVKSIDVSIGFVQSSVTSSKRRKRQEFENRTEMDFPEIISPEPENKEVEKSTENSLDKITLYLESNKEVMNTTSSPSFDISDVIPEPESEGDGISSYTPKGDFHSMDCTDIVIGVAKGNSFRIYDYYTRDRSTPRRDDVFWGESNDVTAGIGFEKDGETTFLFRKKLLASGFSDHSILNQEMNVIWATGQSEESLSESFVSQYDPYELKYHGLKHRGVLSLNFHKEVKQSIGEDAGNTLGFCGGEWKFPQECTKGRNCEYYAMWKYEEASNEMSFVLQSNFSELWTAIGFSDSTSMSQSDVVLGWVDSNGKVHIGDYWANSYFQPSLDDSQDLRETSGSVIDGLLTLQFSRPRNSKDFSQDVSFTNDKGYYFFFPIKGGRFNASNKRFKKHERLPIISSERVFMKPCRTKDGRPSFTTTPKPKELSYKVQIKFIELGPLYKLPSLGTKEYLDLQNKISSNLKDSLIRLSVPGLNDVIVSHFNSETFGEFIAVFIISLDQFIYESREEPSKSFLEKSLITLLNEERIGNLKVEPSSFKFTALNFEELNEDEAQEKDSLGLPIKLILVFACIASLGCIALLQLLCSIVKVFKKNKKRIIKGEKGWRDFSESSHGPQSNFAYETFESHNHPKGRHFSSTIRSELNTMVPRRESQGSSVYSTYDRRAIGAGNLGRPISSDFAPDHYFMPSQRKHK